MNDFHFVFQIEAHEDDVNAVTFADETSHILYSGSDDGLCKVFHTYSTVLAMTVLARDFT